VYYPPPTRAEISFPSVPLSNSVIIRTVTIHCPCEDELAREKTDHIPSCAAEA